ncbi:MULTISPECIES: hypothetical protein [Phyllobacterium]|uniref:hypothetical protein n=1 Tax=Phyllobacterium TaxID=28100 RepID=UPI001CC164E1|nr:hypothetical protein [Phyllobacterium calauticae]MBZ3695505.1 hypothetical protein [Phyllobacterium calauticae]
MTADTPPKFALPKTRRNLSNLDDLLIGVIASPQQTEAGPEMASDMPDVSTNPLPVHAEISPERRDKPVRQASKSAPAVSRSPLKLMIDDSLIVATKVRAAESKTTAASIVEEALRSYLKL